MAETADVLAFGAHPDDVELGVGGTILGMIARGRSVVIVDCTRGELGTRGTPEIREREAREAARLLGVETRVNLELPDGGVLLNDDSRRRVVEVIRRFKPTIVLAPRTDDLHPDHAHAARIIHDAAFLSGIRKWNASGAAHRPRAVLEYASHTQFPPSFVVDITPHFARKKEACLAYRSQFFDPASTEPATYISSSRFWDWWEGRARHYGNMVGAGFGEPFHVATPLRVEDPVAQFEDFGYYPKTKTPG